MRLALKPARPFLLLLMLVLCAGCSTHAPASDGPSIDIPEIKVEACQADRLLAQYTLTYAQILKDAGQAHARRKLSDGQVGKLRAVGRQVELDLLIADSLMRLCRLGAVDPEQESKALGAARASLLKLTALWNGYMKGRR